MVQWAYRIKQSKMFLLIVSFTITNTISIIIIETNIICAHQYRIYSFHWCFLTIFHFIIFFSHLLFSSCQKVLNAIITQCSLHFFFRWQSISARRTFTVKETNTHWERHTHTISNDICSTKRSVVISKFVSRFYIWRRQAPISTLFVTCKLDSILQC